MTKELLTEIVAQAWCTPENEHKEMDVVLAEAIVQKLWDDVFTEGGG